MFGCVAVGVGGVGGIYVAISVVRACLVAGVAVDADVAGVVVGGGFVECVGRDVAGVGCCGVLVVVYIVAYGVCVCSVSVVCVYDSVADVIIAYCVVDGVGDVAAVGVRRYSVCPVVCVGVVCEVNGVGLGYGVCDVTIVIVSVCDVCVAVAVCVCMF